MPGLAEKTDLHQTLMNEVYGYWQSEEAQDRRCNRLEACKHFGPLHTAAVQFGNLNYQVGNGGFAQWIDNGYGPEDVDDLLELTKRGSSQGIQGFAELLNLLIDVKGSMPKGDARRGEVEERCWNCGGRGCECCDDSGYVYVDHYQDAWEDFIHVCETNKWDEAYYALEMEGPYTEFLARFDEVVDTKSVPTETASAGRKPRCRLVGQDGNVYNLAGIVTACLKEAGQKDRAREVGERLHKCKSYEEALCMFMEYVEVF